MKYLYSLFFVMVGIGFIYYIAVTPGQQLAEAFIGGWCLGEATKPYWR